MDWLKLYTDGWLRGSIRVQLTPTERSIWADMLALASESRVRGTVCLSKGVPYPIDMLAAVLQVPRKDLEGTIRKCCQDRNRDDNGYRMKVDESGCLVINNFDYYQAISNRQKETPQEREMRELRQLSMLTRKYPDQANLQVTESITVDSQTGEVLQHKQQLKQPVRAYPKSAQGVKRDKGRTRRPGGVPKPQEL